MRGITRDCVAELFDRKIIWLFAVITLIAVVVIILSGNIQFGGSFTSGDDMDIGEVNDMLGNPIMRVFSSFVSFLVILVVMATAGLIPSMMIRGRSDFYLSKPISRTSLLLNKFFGIWISYGAMIVICGLIGYGVMYMVHGISGESISYLFVLNLFSLFIWLCITTFAGIVFGSTSMAIISAALVWFAQWVLGWHDYLKQIVDSEALTGTVDVLYYIVPKTGELSDLTVSLALGNPVTSWMPLWSSLIFAFMLLVITIMIFNRKNY